MKASLHLSSALGAVVVAASVQFGAVGTANAQFIEPDYCNPVWVRSYRLEQPVISRNSRLVVRHDGSFPCPEPEKPMVTEYLIFFDFDRSEITPEAAEIVRSASSAAQGMSAARVEVVGHTDTSGNPIYNQGLSERRAAATESELIVNGVSPVVITTEGRGETDLLVQTADGVREPSNRRAEINLTP